MTILARTAFTAVMLAIAATAPATGEDVGLATNLSDEPWRLSAQPYLFLPVTTTGTSTVAGSSVDLDLDLRDIFEALNFAFSMRAEAWKGNFGLMADLYYVNIGGDGRVPVPGPLPGSAGVDVSVKQGWLAFLGGYRFAQGSVESVGGTPKRWTLDAGVGFRYNILRQEIDADLQLDIGEGIGFQRTLGGTETFIEPTVSLRGAMEVSERWTLGSRADLGGFGVNGDDLQWLVVAGADYRPWANTSLKLGWQFYSIDFATNRSDGRFAYDVFQTGPYLGLTIGF